MRRRRGRAPRRGFAIMLVCVFLVVMLAMLGATFRQMATALRVETYRSAQVRRRQEFENLGSRWVASRVLSGFEQNGDPGASPPPATMPGPDLQNNYSVHWRKATDPASGDVYWVVTVQRL